MKVISGILESQSSHFDADCFACVVLTHGDEGGLVYGSDGAIHIDQLIAPFRGSSCPSLCGKPKMFFIQVSFVVQNNINIVLLSRKYLQFHN